MSLYVATLEDYLAALRLLMIARRLEKMVEQVKDEPCNDKSKSAALLLPASAANSPSTTRTGGSISSEDYLDALRYERARLEGTLEKQRERFKEDYQRMAASEQDKQDVQT